MNKKACLKGWLTALGLALLFLPGCVGTKNGPPPGETCEQVAVVRDYRTLDGCGFLLELEKGGELLFIGEWAVDEPEALAPDQRVRISYEIMEDAMSICMREKYVVRITCFEILKK